LTKSRAVRGWFDLSLATLLREYQAPRLGSLATFQEGLRLHGKSCEKCLPLKHTSSVRQPCAVEALFSVGRQAIPV